MEGPRGMSSDPGKLEAACARWLESPTRQLGTGVAVGLAMGAGAATQLFVNWSLTGLEPSLPALLALKVTEFVLWGAAVPLVVHIDRHMDWSDGWLRPVGVHLAVAVGLFFVVNVPVTALTKFGDATLPTLSWSDRYVFRLSYRLPSSWLTYAVILTVVKLVQGFVRSQKLQRDLTRAQLQVLRDQLEPHFLFNTLHTVGSLVRDGDRRGALRTLSALADLLRRSLRHGRLGTVPLREEIDFLDRYLDIHRSRFGEHLTVEIDVPRELGAHPVPAFLLQPLVENSIMHGLELDRGGAGRVSVRVRRDSDAGGLHVEVRDSGGALESLPASENGDGIGLVNLRRRLATLYGPRASLVAEAEEGASVVRVTLPWQETPR